MVVTCFITKCCQLRDLKYTVISAISSELDKLGNELVASNQIVTELCIGKFCQTVSVVVVRSTIRVLC